VTVARMLRCGVDFLAAICGERYFIVVTGKNARALKGSTDVAGLGFSMGDSVDLRYRVTELMVRREVLVNIRQGDPVNYNLLGTLEAHVLDRCTRL